MPIGQALTEQVELAGLMIQDDLDIALEAETMSECRAFLKRARQRVGTLVEAAQKAQAEADGEDAVAADQPLSPS
jgi:hypothetical protein